MFKLLITGNGFDIARGLPTKYENFLTFMGNVKDDKWYEDLNYKEEYKSNLVICKAHFSKVLQANP